MKRFRLTGALFALLAISRLSQAMAGGANVSKDNDLVVDLVEKSTMLENSDSSIRIYRSGEVKMINCFKPVTVKSLTENEVDRLLSGLNDLGFLSINAENVFKDLGYADKFGTRVSDGTVTTLTVKVGSRSRCVSFYEIDVMLERHPKELALKRFKQSIELIEKTVSGKRVDSMENKKQPTPEADKP